MSISLKAPLASERESPHSDASMAPRVASYVALLQGIYYAATGVWPMLSIDTFQMVTGPKTDLWLVQTVGALIAVVGLVLLVAAWRRSATAEVVLLALASAVALGAVDVVFVVRQVIAPIYLPDAVAEALLVLMWLLALKWDRFIFRDRK